MNELAGIVEEEIVEFKLEGKAVLMNELELFIEELLEIIEFIEEV